MREPIGATAATTVEVGNPGNVAAAPALPAHGRLLRKYISLFAGVVCLALLTSSLLQIWFSYREQTNALVRVQSGQAEAAADKIEQFISEIEGQLGWTTQLPWSEEVLEQRRFDFLRLLRQVPAITEVALLDETGVEQLRVSRLALDVVGSRNDFSEDARFTDVVAGKIHYGSVYFRQDSEPYMTSRAAAIGGQPASASPRST